MEFRQLRYFVAAAEEGHFGRAANRLNVSAPGVGQQIRELEDELGVELFERLPRGVRLTAAGAALLADARRLLVDRSAAIERARDVGRGRSGILRVGHIPIALMPASSIRNIIPGFCVRYPNVEVRSLDLNSAEQCLELSEQRIDVGIIFAQPQSAFGFASEVLTETLLDGALLPAEHPLAQKGQLHCRDLAVLSLLDAPVAANPTSHDFILGELRARGLDARCDPEHQISDSAVRISLIAAGVGWMPMSSSTVDMLLSGTPGVVFRKWAETPIRYPSVVVWRANDASSLVASFVAFCREVCAGITSPREPQVGAA